MAAKILLVEDEEKIARFIELELLHEGYEVEKTHNGREGLLLAQSGKFDLVLLDIMLPELNGLEVLRRLRKESDVPVIMLTARDAVMDKVSGLDAGADDYITKPFAIEELLARIRVALKKRDAVRAATLAVSGMAAGGMSAGDGVFAAPMTRKIAVNGVEMDLDRHEVLFDGEIVELNHREYELLRVLMENRNIVMNREQLMNQVCGYDYCGETNIIDVYVRHIRAKLDDRFGVKIITTVRGVGYVIREK